MNKLCYRIVFNKTRGKCMVVQETARSRSKGPGVGAAGEAASNVMHLPALRRLALLVGVGLGGIGFTHGVMAQIVADPHAPGQQRANVLNAANGVLQVNIQTPSGAGVSRNVYSQFDVPKSGAILNNSRTSVQSQLGGWVQGNPWLGTGTARVILNEVNSNNPSHLQGYIEVAGARAETVIANPAGIVVDGGGFINVSRATLTTGSPVLEDGRVKGYAVQRGQIVIGGAGLDASKTDYTALIARSLQVNAGLWAQRLNMITGVNDVAESEQAAVTQAGQAKDAAPAYAVDVARLGGMYANQIYLVGTEAGVGVHNAGAIGAAAGDLVVTAAGRLENSGTLSATRDARVDATTIANQGRVQAGEMLALHAGGISNAGRLASGRELRIAAQGEVDNSQGRIEAPRIDLTGASLRNAQGSIVQSGAQALAIDAADVINAAGVLGRQTGSAAGDTATSTGGVTSPDGPGTAVGQDSATAPDPAPSTSPALPMLAEGRVQVGTLDNTAGVIASNGAAVLRTGSLDNHTGHALLDTLAVSGPTFDNTGGVLTVLQGIDVHAGRFVNDQGKLQVAAAFTGTLGTFSNRQGLLQAAQIDIHATDLLDNSAGTIQATHDLALQSSGTILNAAGSVGTLSDTSTLSMTGAAIDNGDGRIVNAGSGATVVRADVIASHGLIGGNGDVHIAGHAVRNDASGTVTAQGDLNLAADVLFANAGRVDAGGRLQVLQDGAQLNNSGTLAAHGPIDIHVASVDNGAGTIATAAGTGSPVALAAGGLGNRAGTIVADGQAVLTIRGRVDNEHGHIRAGAGLSLDAAERIENRGGDIESAGSLLLHAMDIGNDAGRIVAVGPQAALIDAGRAIDSNGSIGANGRLTLRAQTLANGPAGTVSARGDLDLIVSTAVDNAGTIGTPGALRLDQANATLVNHGSMTAGANVYLNVGRVDNRGGRVIAGQDAAVLVGNAFDNGGGAVQAAGSLAVTAGGALRNQEGTIEALGEHGTLTVHAGAIDNAAGRINGIGDGMATVDATGHIANSGLIAGNGRLTVSGVSLDNAGTISAGAQAELAVTRQVDNSGTISAATGLTMHQAILDVRNSGTIVAGGSIDAAVATIDNANGRIVAVQGSGGDVLIDARSIGNHDGLIAADHDAIVTVAENVDGQGGLLQAGAQLQLDAGGHVDVSAGGIDTLSGGGTLQVHARALRNEAGHIVNAGHGATRVQVDEDLLNSGRMASNGELVVEARTLTNASGGAIVAAGDVAVRAGVIDNDGGRLATAHGSGASIVLDALGVSNRGGSIQADHDLQVRSADAVDNTGGLLQAAGSLVASARGAMVNDGGVIETLGTDATLSLHAGKLDNGSGRLTNVGNGATALTVDASLVSRGTVAGNGSVALHVGDLQNGADGSIVAGGTLRIDVARDIGNHGTISSRHAATVDATHGQVTNHGTIVSGGGATLAAARIDNDAGQIATTTGSAGDIALCANDVSNVGGNVLADGALTIAASGALDNHQGTVRAARAIHIDAGGALGNQDGAIEVATADSALHVSAESIDNERGRLVNAGAGATEIAAKGDILNGGALGGNGTVEVRAGTVHNHVGGSIASGAALEMRIDDRLDNAGKIDAGTTLHIGQATAQIVNAGEIAAAGDLALHGAAIANDGGRIVTRSGADVVLRSESTLGNRAGVIGSQGSVTVQSRAGFDNTHGQVQTSGALSVNVDGVVTNAGGLLESVGAGSTLTLRADAVENAAGRIVNTGAGEMRIESATDIVNGGTIGGNGALSLSAQDVKNASDGVISAGTALALSIGRQLENAGSIGSGAGMRVDVASGTLKNMGNLSAGASVEIAAGAFGNQGGHVMTRDGSGAAISVAASSLDNTNGTVAADGMLQAALTGAVVNDGGTLHGGSGVSLDAGAALVNAGGTIEAASRTLALRAASIDSSGRIVNAGTGATTIQATGAVVNSGAVAANGALALAAQTWRNTDAAAVGSGADLELAVRERLDNAGTISSGGTLRFEQVTAALDNSGRIGAHGSIDIVASSVTNRGGQLYTATDSVAAVTLQTQSLDNANGTISADGLLHVQTAGGVANTGGQLHGGTGTLLAAGEDLRNGTGIIETGTGSLEIGARSIDSAGRIVNAGTGQTAIFSATGVLNSGTIAGNGALALSAQTLQNLKSGTIGAGGAMDLAVNHQLDNAGRVGSGTSLHVRQPDGGFSNDGTVEAGGPIEITARAIDNQAGQIDTVAGSGATVRIDTGSLQNASGTISADGTLGIDVANAIANDGGTLHGGTGAALRAGGLLANGSGVIESAAERWTYGRSRSPAAGASSTRAPARCGSRAERISSMPARSPPTAVSLSQAGAWSTLRPFPRLAHLTSTPPRSATRAAGCTRRAGQVPESA